MSLLRLYANTHLQAMLLAFCCNIMQCMYWNERKRSVCSCVRVILNQSKIIFIKTQKSNSIVYSC